MSELLYSNGPLQDGSLRDADEEELYTLGNVGLHVSRGDARLEEAPSDPEDWGPGELNVTSRRIIWKGRTSFSLEMRLLGLHAVARDPWACLYAQILLDDFPPSSDHPSELYFVPPAESHLTDLFDAFSRSAALNPDMDDDDADDKVEEQPDPEAMLARFDDMLTIAPGLAPPVDGQFDDALEEDEDT